LVEAAVNVSDYTNSVDKEFKSAPLHMNARTAHCFIYDRSFIAKNGRRHAQLQNICSFLSGIVSAQSYTAGQACVQERSFAQHEEYIQKVLEIARRYKVCSHIFLPRCISASHFGKDNESGENEERVR
jgi:hypothetical protein